MSNLTEKSSYEELNEAWKEVNDYGVRAFNAKDVQRAFKKGARIVFRRVNTHAKNQALYIFVKTKTKMMHMPFLIVEGSEGDTFVSKENEARDNDQLMAIHSHAINRYIERHGWDGTLEECQCYLLSSMWVVSFHVDKYTKDATVYFDDGVFLGCVKDGICHLNTYVANQHLYPNQRLKSRQLQEAIEELFEELDKQ